ncbi:hypothetical protein CH63R_07323 [Colletotrichum higginsianum IMI 349063]|uniref:Uncharacterized protein n=1 Tax=Colletotrichum higginsianum (strain IMI 349063) TaxID=759273 RepID=A0A1B7Y9N5_COLHI|nr:hypothetical protein CH63R_07323 [Colletotrichum higginsianum IMI 349063]OBR08558.1 hypothetical protein CH63R_07323 [Colletotrichum higginsianum IMI 349063]GJC97368.1 hypothetical protein ColKHC_06194 [Colletotrichum higginsianum]
MAELYARPWLASPAAHAISDATGRDRSATDALMPRRNAVMPLRAAAASIARRWQSGANVSRPRQQATMPRSMDPDPDHSHR